MGIEVDTQTLRGSARMLSEADCSVRAHHPDQHLHAATGALPGGASERAAGALERAWQGAFAAWHTTAESHERALDEAADTHDAVDQGVGRAFEGAYGRIPR